MRLGLLPTLWLVGVTVGQSSSSTLSSQAVTIASISRDYLPGVTLPSILQPSTIATTTRPQISSRISTLNSSISISASTPHAFTSIGGSNKTTTPSNTQNSPPRPSNTQPCNNYPELCTRKYSNITEVCAHNSPFTRQRNVARNQDYGVTQQLNDGVRVLTGQAHYVNNTLYFCHTSCDLLNAGTVEDYLREVTAWVEVNPFDVVTIIFGNYNWADVDKDGNPLVTSAAFAVPIANSGLLPYIYQPPKTTMTLADWPTLGELILSQKRVVTFIDYNFDTDAVPYMLWEFYNIWETPYSPTSTEFPCSLGRPEGVASEQMGRMMYMANHNLNVEISVAGYDLLIPNVAEMRRSNGVEGLDSLGEMVLECTSKYSRFLCILGRMVDKAGICVVANNPPRRLQPSAKLPPCRLLQPRSDERLRLRSRCQSEQRHV